MQDTLSRKIHIRRFEPDDLDPVVAIEASVSAHPWTRQIFKDCVRVGYAFWILRLDEQVVGFAIVSCVLDEAHLLNFAIDQPCQRQGLGRHFMEYLFQQAIDQHIVRYFLEVRPSNTAARALYEKLGFVESRRRKDYYPTASGREDAIVMETVLQSPDV